MAKVNIEVVEEFVNPYNKRRYAAVNVTVVRSDRCNNCDKIIERVRDRDGKLRTPPHNRKVFRKMKKDGTPDWIIEACPGGKI